MATKVVVLCSGGLDSTTLLAQAVQTYGAQQVVALSIFYGQKHHRELQAAQAVSGYYGVELKTLNLTGVFAESNSSLLTHSDQAIPTESYAEQLKNSDTALVSTYVPFRNGLFLSAAASMALSLKASILFYGAHHDDWAGDAYPDCSQAFVEAMNRAIVEGTGGEL